MKRSNISVIGIFAICIIGFLAVEGTIAYRVDETPKQENHFAFIGEGVLASLAEPSWDEDNAVNLVPGTDIPKDPQIYNTGRVDEWAAIKVTFCYGPDAGANTGKPLSPADLAKVLAAVTINWNTAQWTRFDDSTSLDTSSAAAVSQAFSYNSIILAADAAAVPPVSAGSTIPLFTKVSINVTNTQAQMSELKAMGGFQLFIEGCAVQSEVTDSMTAAAARDSFVFSDTPT